MTSKSRFPKIFCAAFFFVFVFVYVLGAFTGMQHVWHDLMFKAQPSVVKAADPRLILLAIDEETGAKHGFPLPRALYARALDKMKALGVRTVVFDMLFFERRDGDAELAAATQRFGRVVHLFAFDAKFVTKGNISVVTEPVKPLLAAGRYFGHPNIDFLQDKDGHLRAAQLFHPDIADPYHKGLNAASLAASTRSAFLDKPLEEVKAIYGSDVKTLNFRRSSDWLKHEWQAQKQGDQKEFVPAVYRRISMIDLLAGHLTDSQKKALKGSIVMIGSTALGYYDHYPTPLAEAAPGAEFHLNALDNMLNGDSLSAQTGDVTLLCILLAVLLSYALQRFSPGMSAGLSGGAVAAWIFYALWSFRRGVLVDFVVPFTAFVSSYLILSVHRVLAEGAEKKMIKGMFGQFVSPEIVEQLARDPSKVKLGGEKREMTVFFLDIAHFTNISEKMDPAALIQFLNRYLSALSLVILERRGTIDKYIGDCIMAFWNAPLENKNHRVDAILSALACQEVIKELNKTLDPGVPEVPAVRIGINSGIVTVGLTGSEKKLQYTVIGDEVNLASRLEGANKFFGSKIIISESAYAGCTGRIAVRTLGRVRVVGKDTPIRIFEPVGEQGKLSAQWQEALPVYEGGVAAFEAKKYEEALAFFQKFAEIFPKDGPGQLYLNRCQEYAVLAPDAAWDGVFNLTAK
ncbi:MAG: adenylate/guanylate cyclase domain-containing protein [Elusimicrobiota bacterium]